MNTRYQFVVPALLMLLGPVACDGHGGGGGGGTSPTGTSIYPRYIYVANHEGNSVSTYAVNAATGRLTLTGKVAAGEFPTSVAVDPSGKHAYVANMNSANVSQYTIGADGSLTPMGTPTVAAGSNP